MIQNDPTHKIYDNSDKNQDEQQAKKIEKSTKIFQKKTNELIDRLKNLEEENRKTKKTMKSIINSEGACSEEALNRFIPSRLDNIRNEMQLFKEANDKIIRLNNKIRETSSEMHLAKKEALNSAFSKAFITSTSLNNFIQVSMYKLTIPEKISKLNTHLTKLNLLISELIESMNKIIDLKFRYNYSDFQYILDQVNRLKEICKESDGLKLLVIELNDLEDKFGIKYELEELKNKSKKQNKDTIFNGEDVSFLYENLQQDFESHREKYKNRLKNLYSECKETWNEYKIRKNQVNNKILILNGFKNIQIKLWWCYVVSRCKTIVDRYELLNKLINLSESELAASNVFFLDTNFLIEGSPSKNIKDFCYLSNNYDLSLEHELIEISEKKVFPDIESRGMFWDSEEKKEKTKDLIHIQETNFMDEYKRYENEIRENTQIVYNTLNKLQEKKHHQMRGYEHRRENDHNIMRYIDVGIMAILGDKDLKR